MFESPEKFFVRLEKYKNVSVDETPYHPPGTKPGWYDAKLFARGQQFIRKNYTNIAVSELLSLYTLFTFSANFDPLIFSQRSDTVGKAAVRYYETVMRVKSWYESDPWDSSTQAYKNIVVVRFFHSYNSRKMNLKGKAKVKTELDPIKSKWNGSCPVSFLDKTNSKFSEHLRFLKESDKFLTQPEMSLTLFGFMGLTLLYPEKFGIFNATEEDQEAFVHFWRTIGHLLGIQDDINFCNGSLAEVKARCHAFLRTAVVPNFHEIDKNWEHMSKCAIQGSQSYLTFISFESTLMYLFWVLDLKCEEFKKTVTYWNQLLFQVYIFYFQYLQRFSLIKELANSAMHRKLISFGQSETFQKLREM